MLNHQYLMHATHILVENNYFLTTDNGKILFASNRAGHVWDFVINCIAMSELYFNVPKIVMQKVRYWCKTPLCILIHSMKEINLQLVLMGAFQPTWNISLSLVLLSCCSILQC